MKEELIILSQKTAVVAIDMHQGHLDPTVGPMLVAEKERKKVLKKTKQLLKIVRNYEIPVIHVLFHLRPIENQRRFDNHIKGFCLRGRHLPIHNK